MENGALLHSLQGHLNEIYGLDWSPIANLVVSGSGDHTVRRIPSLLTHFIYKLSYGLGYWSWDSSLRN